MELPDSLIGSSVGEGEKYFFTADCPIGIREHIHICIKRKSGIIDESGLSLIAKGVILSPDVEHRIKDLFRES